MSTHEICGTEKASILPTRVLDLGGNEGDLVKLYEAQDGEKGHYISLSHSWGGEHPLITTTATLDDHKTGIPLEKLPKTFREAAMFTRRLGIRYLWIDTLCIIQDSAEDWSREAGRMAAIYNNSWITISATCSSSPSKGLFTQGQAVMIDLRDDKVFCGLTRKAQRARPQRDLRLHLSHEIAHAIVTGSDEDNTNYISSEMSTKLFPLLDRAWAFQERFLAPRVLHFGKQELFWECGQQGACECGGILKPSQTRGLSSRKADRDMIPAKVQHYSSLFDAVEEAAGDQGDQEGDDEFGDAASDGGASREALLLRWTAMVYEYSERKLTYPGDRLPAFSGMATQMAEVLRMNYRAGTWEETLPIDLLWRRQTHSDRPLLSQRPGTGAPSWSWAVVDSLVNFEVPLTAYEFLEDGGADVVEVRCMPAGENDKGQMRLGESFIILDADIVSAALCFDPGSPWEEPWVYAGVNAAKQGFKPNRTLDCYMVKVEDYDPVYFTADFELCDEEGKCELKEGELLYCVKIICYGDLYWLVVRRIQEDPEVFERIGYLGGSDTEDWQNKVTRKQIKLV